MSDKKRGPVVYVTQIPNRNVGGLMVPAVNISPAVEHGEVCVLMPPTASFFATQDMITQLRAGLRDYSFEHGDSVIALGDPAIIGVVGALLMERGRSFNVLRWDRNLGRYVKISITI